MSGYQGQNQMNGGYGQGYQGNWQQPCQGGYNQGCNQPGQGWRKPFQGHNQQQQQGWNQGYNQQGYGQKGFIGQGMKRSDSSSSSSSHGDQNRRAEK